MSKLAHSNDETMEQIERDARERDATINDEPGAEPDAETTDYAVVEVYGHRRLAGRVTEVEKFGAKLLRIDIPKDGKFEQGFTTQYYGGGSIFSMTPCDLAVVERENKRHEPVGRLTYYDEPSDEADEDEITF